MTERLHDAGAARIYQKRRTARDGLIDLQSKG